MAVELVDVILGQMLGRKNHDRYPFGVFMFLERLDDVESVHAGHEEIKQHQVRLDRPGQLDRLSSAVCPS